MTKKSKKISLSKRGASVPPSPIRKLSPLAIDAKNRGLKIYHLNIGQPDIESPPEFFEGLRLFNQKVVAYEQAKGNEALCNAWSNYMNRSVGTATKPEHFLITCGASEALLFVFMAVCDPGDEIIVFDPTYANFISLAIGAAVKLRPCKARLEDDFALPPPAKIKSLINDKTRAIIVCNPNNPTGTVYSKAELQDLITICNEHNLFLIADETYREFVYDGEKLSSVFNLEPDNQRLIVVDSLSKRFSLCGARLGCVITKNEEVFNATHRLAQARLAAPSVEQFASAHMLEKIKENFIEKIRTEYQTRRDTLYGALKSIKGVSVHKPKGAFYTICELPVSDGEEFAAFMLKSFDHNKATTFVAPAAGFYMTPKCGKKEVRIAYVLKPADIIAAIDCLARGLQRF